MSLINEFAREIVCYVSLGQWVWRVRRVNTDTLRRVGHAHLEGSEAYRRVQEEIARERQEQIVAQSHPDEESRQAALARMAEAEQRRSARKLQALVAKPESEAALLDRCDAYLCAAIDAGAVLAQPREGAHRYDEEPPLAKGWTPWVWTRDGEEADDTKGHVPIGFLSTTDRTLLGLVVQGAQEGLTRRRVAHFRPGHGAASDPAPTGAGVRDGSGGDRGDVEP